MDPVPRVISSMEFCCKGVEKGDKEMRLYVVGLREDILK